MMEAKLRAHVEALFANAPHTPKAAELREEMILNLIEKYHDLLRQGMSEEAAYHMAVASIGDMSELIASLRAETQDSTPNAYYTPSGSTVGGTKEKMGEGSSVRIVKIICWTLVALVGIGLIGSIFVFHGVSNILGQVFHNSGWFSDIFNSVGQTVGNAVDDAFNQAAIRLEDGTSTTIDKDYHFFDHAYAADGGYSTPVGGVEKVLVDWLGGSVTIAVYDGEEIEIQEQAKNAIDQDVALRYGMIGNQLIIQYCQQKSWMQRVLPTKQLTVKIPRALAENLNELAVESVSAQIEISDIAAQQLLLDTVSGNIRLFRCKASKMNLVTVSGAQIVEEAAADELVGETVSGSLRAEGAFDKGNLQSVSGSVEFTGNSCPTSLNIETTSGSVRLNLPESCGAVIGFDTVSGSFHSTAAMVHNGSSYTLGDGSGQIDVDTVSGSLHVSVGK